MNWLDDMEAADPAYPSPGEEDPWAAADYVPGASQAASPEVSNIIGDWARQQNGPDSNTAPRLDYDLGAVRVSAQERLAQEAAAAGMSVEDWAYVPYEGRGPGYTEPPADWEPEAGDGRAEIRQPPAAWNTGRGASADGPEAGS